MYLVRLVYTSTMSDDFSHEDIPSILESARKNNAKSHVTGLLCFSRKLFLQCLEGTRTDVNETYHRILNDPRHSRVVILDYKEVFERKFSQWSMGYIPESSLTAPINLKYSGKESFNPYGMSGESALRLLSSLQDSVPTQS